MNRSARLICRSSGRGCTVIPWAPRSSIKRAILIRSGLLPPRAFLMVAILLILTLSLVIDSPLPLGHAIFSRPTEGRCVQRRHYSWSFARNHRDLLLMALRARFYRNRYIRKSGQRRFCCRFPWVWIPIVDLAHAVQLPITKRFLPRL